MRTIGRGKDIRIETTNIFYNISLTYLYTEDTGQKAEKGADLENTFKSFSSKFLKTTSIQVLDYICSTDTAKAGR